MNISELRVLAENAKAWKPEICNCECDNGHLLPICRFCIGAKAVVKDVRQCINLVTACIGSGHSHDSTAHIKGFCLSQARDAEYLASYLGGSDAVTSFTNAVREFVSG